MRYNESSMSVRLHLAFCAFVAIALRPAVLAQVPVAPQSETPVAALVAPEKAPVAVPDAALISPAVTPSMTQTQATIPPINARSRLHWLLVENLGIGSLLDDIAVGAVDTGFNTPKEYKSHWAGFGERAGMVTANYAIKSTMEAGLGSIWGEDPRYFRTTGLSTKIRMAYVIKMTFMAQDRAGNTMPAYSRYIAFPAASFLSNEWQPTSQATADQAMLRVGLGFLSRMGENAWKEFIARK
jgi:hypothetical protein